MKKLSRLYLLVSILFISFLIINNKNELIESALNFKKIPSKYISLFLLLTVLSYYLRSLRWLVLIRNFEKIESKRIHSLIYFSGFSFTASPGKSGELIKSSYLMHFNVSFKKTLLSFFIERSMDIAIVSFLTIKVFLPAINIIDLLLLGLFSLSIYLITFKCIYQIKPLEYIKFLITFPAMSCFLLTLLTWSIQGSILHLVLNIQNVELSLLHSIAIYCASLIIGALSMIPAGIAITEASMTFLLIQVGVSKDLAIASSIITRTITLWPAILIGLIATLLIEKFYKEKFVENEIS